MDVIWSESEGRLSASLIAKFVMIKASVCDYTSVSRETYANMS